MGLFHLWRQIILRAGCVDCVPRDRDVVAGADVGTISCVLSERGDPAPDALDYRDCFVAALLAMTEGLRVRPTPSRIGCGFPRDPCKLTEMRTLTTSRLILRPLTLHDAPALQAGFPRWEIVRYLDSVGPAGHIQKMVRLTYIRDVALPGMQRGREWYMVDPAADGAGAIDRGDLPAGQTGRQSWLLA